MHAIRLYKPVMAFAHMRVEEGVFETLASFGGLFGKSEFIN